MVEPLGESCSSICDIDVPPGTELSLTATPDAGSAFSGWDTIVGCPTLAPCVFTIDANREVSAEFVLGATNVMFTTRASFTGLGLNSVEEADAHCQDAADAGGVDGNFVALFSSRDSDAIDRLADARGWVRRDGNPVGNSLAEIAAGQSYYPPLLDEDGEVIPTRRVAWTGSTPDGRVATTEDGEPLDCTNWGSANEGANMGGFGIPGGGGPFMLEAGTADLTGCLLNHHLICAQRDYIVHVEAPPPPADGIQIFVSSPFDPGSGVAGADAVCNADALAAYGAGHPPFVALLAVAPDPLASRLVAGQFSRHWVRADGLSVGTATTIASDLQLQVPVLFHPDGSLVTTPEIWTGSAESFLTAGQDCANWSLAPGLEGAIGHSASALDWAFAEDRPCAPDPNFGVLCLEVPE